MNGIKKKLAVLICLLLVSSMVLTTAAVSAAKPDKPDKPGKPGGGDGTGPTGTIFFHMYDDNDDLYIWTVEPDGSSLTKQNLLVAGVGSLSWKTHDEHYWYVGLVAIGGDPYPDGQPRQEIYAIRDDNTMGFQITDDEDMAFSSPDWAGSQPIWVPGDVYISWVGKVWTEQDDGTYAYAGYGIYRAEVQYTNGDVSGLGDPVLVYDTGSYYDEYNDVYHPNVHGYDWNPEGDELAIQMHDNYIYIDSIDGDSPTQLVNGWAPKWSPDGTMIAFGRSKEILVIDVDGTDETSLKLVSNTKSTVRGIWGHEWSPDSKYVMYTIWERNLHKWGQKTTMYTIEPDGSGRSSISGLSIGTWKYSRDWR
ncbi:MAG: PD40 domain-containing protein [Thermoplasmata archaeon]|nr:PD40 domain-containing protein [Thermoplasmata archaeon]